ncbi:MAG: repressor LexA [Verrucomicrobia bacterium]|nr:repressor LexA [Verrucomicrobiota bacterium]
MSFTDFHACSCGRGRYQREHGTSPSQREIASFFDFRSVTAVADHLRALRRKGYLEGAANQARSLRVIAPPSIFEPIVRSRIVDIPLLGEIPAGFADKRDSGSIEGCVSVDVDTLGVKPTSRTFALEVRGDSMIGRHIMHGDYAILEHGVEPRGGEVVAALIDNESTLKTFVKEKGKAYLRAENPRYPDLIPAGELVIQGVMVALIRRCR